MKLASPSFHRHLRIALLVAAAAAVSLVLTECRMVTDSVMATSATGLGNGSSNAGNCISGCARAYADSMQAESRFHVDNIRGCGGDLNCLDFENIRHTRAVERISAGRKACMDRCHHQGGGHGR